MDDLSMKIQYDMFQKLRNQSVSILFDSCTRWKRNFQGIILFSQMRLFLYSIVETADSKAKTIKSIIDDAVTQLRGYDISVISISTDNCNTNKSAFDHQHIYRQPCSAHTGNLAIKDMFDDGDYKITDDMYVLLRNVPDEITTHNTPYLMTIRWKSMYECVKFIYNNINFYEKSQIPEVQESLQNIQKIIGWNDLFSMVKIMWDFISSVEKDLASIADILPPF